MSDSIKNLSDDQRVELLAAHYKAILEILGEDPTREGLVKTPLRAAKAMLALTSGYKKSPEAIIKSAIFKEEYGSRGQMVVVKDIEFYSFCEHHILPFFGKVHIGYVPNGCVTGLSKLARLVDAFARRLQLQERLTAEICESLQAALDAQGVIVVVESRHLCMQMRGVEKQGAVTTTSSYTGVFEELARREEFFAMIGRR
ncbi:MAG TPA: GTP cyclohydrolase I FolE [Candidatus Caccoplasma merdavium]|nr:GTP cyclohydrolase I FolE [Candidatus Caccoplasma merdavium]